MWFVKWTLAAIIALISVVIVFVLNVLRWIVYVVYQILTNAVKIIIGVCTVIAIWGTDGAPWNSQMKIVDKSKHTEQNQAESNTDNPF